ncbi:MAG TPA: sulfatase [Tepidisphaeraceae bacterium]|jgi:uncharacterized sulfatase|nr:sulfatase [Tepidisphaeraceae bacterium]
MIRKYIFLFLAFCLLCPTFASAADRKLNVLLIISDDLCADLGCYGAPTITPNIDAFAKNGVRLDHIYCNYPLCGPSRCSFLSGLRPDTIGVIANGYPVRYKLKDVVTLPQNFRQHGYFVARAGKAYHLGIPFQVGTPGPDDPQSWDYAFNPKGNEYPSLDDGDQYDPNPKNQQSFRRNLLKDPEGKTQADYEIATETIRLLDEHQHADKPFFLVCGFIRPHMPEIAPKQYFDQYDINKIHLPDNPPNDRDDIPLCAFQYKAPDMGMTHEDCLQAKRGYYAVTSFMDHQFGRVLAEVDRLHLRDNTLIIFMSDHGYMLGQHQAWQKTQLWEECTRVPMIFSYPDMPHRDVGASGMAESVDLYPTICDLTSVPGPKVLEGMSFRPILENPAAPFKDAAYTQVNRKQIVGRSVHTLRYRYTEWDHGDQGTELYDLQTDPHEYTNLAKDPSQSATIQHLQSLLRAHEPAQEPKWIPGPPEVRVTP